VAAGCRATAAAVAEAGRLEVLVEVRLQSEGFVTFAAVVTLGGRVRLHVCPQVGTVGEGFAAVGAAVRFLSRMGPHVTLEQPRAGKSFAADGAHMRESVRQEMHRQRRHRDVRLAACGARPSTAGLETAVRLFVTRQVG